MINKITFVLILVNSIFANDTFYYENDKKINLEKVINNSRSLNDITYYKKDNGIVLGIKNTIIVQFIKTNNLNKYLDLYELEIKKEYKNKLYLLEVKDKEETINIANILDQKEDILYSNPNFNKIKKRK